MKFQFPNTLAIEILFLWKYDSALPTSHPTSRTKHAIPNAVSFAAGDFEVKNLRFTTMESLHALLHHEIHEFHLHSMDAPHPC